MQALSWFRKEGKNTPNTGGRAAGAARAIRAVAGSTAVAFDRDSAEPTPAFRDGVHRLGGRTVAYKLFEPSRPAKPAAPLIVMLHGCTQDADDFATGTAMNAVAEAEGLYVLYPMQNGAANINKCWNWFKPAHQRRERGEPKRLAALTRDVCEAHPIDARRVFVAGLSAGGSMALILAETYPELFAAVGVHSGLATGVARSLPQALAVMKSGDPGKVRSTSKASREVMLPKPHFVIHGGNDAVVHSDNAQLIVDACLARVADGSRISVRERHGKGARQRAYSLTIYRDRGRGVICEHWHVPTGAHAWSGGDPAGSHTEAEGPDASAEMVRFFLAAAG